MPCSAPASRAHPMASAAFRLSLQVMIWIGWPLIPPALLMASAAASAPLTLSTKLAAGVARMPVAMILTGEPDAATSLLALAPPWELLALPWELLLHAATSVVAATAAAAMAAR